MKKFATTSLNLIILSTFLATNTAFCKEEFFFFNKTKEAKSIEKPTLKEKIINLKKEKNKSFFEKFKKTKKEEIKNKGYYGTLPDIQRDFKHKQQSVLTQPKVDEMIIEDFSKIDFQNLKEAPYDDALFLDNIIQVEKPSEYLKDIQRIKYSLNSLKECLENGGEIQKFNACVYLIDLYVKNLEKKYKQKEESNKESYFALLNVNYNAKILGNLMYDANYYSRYIPTNQGKYSKENIKNEQVKLLKEINATLFLLNEER